MVALPIVLAALGTIEAVTGAIVFVEFVKYESIKTLMMAATDAVRFNQRAKAKEMYSKIRDVYALDLAQTVGRPSDFDPDLVAWANWPEWDSWTYGSMWDSYDWGSLAPYSKPAFVGFVNSSLLTCRTNLDIL